MSAFGSAAVPAACTVNSDAAERTLVRREPRHNAIEIRAAAAVEGQRVSGGQNANRTGRAERRFGRLQAKRFERERRAIPRDLHLAVDGRIVLAGAERGRAIEGDLAAGAAIGWTEIGGHAVRGEAHAEDIVLPEDRDVRETHGLKRKRRRAAGAVRPVLQEIGRAVLPAEQDDADPIAADRRHGKSTG